jgi:hypothetical protein
MSDQNTATPAAPLADAYASRKWAWQFLSPERRASLEAASRAPEQLEPGALPDARASRPWAQGYAK